jgi:hypothetical protein
MSAFSARPNRLSRSLAAAFIALLLSTGGFYSFPAAASAGGDSAVSAHDSGPDTMDDSAGGDQTAGDNMGDDAAQPGAEPAAPHAGASDNGNSESPGTLDQDFNQIESIGLLSQGADGGLGEDVWVGSDRATITRLIPAAPRVTGFPEIQDLLRRLYLTAAKPDYFNKNGNRPDPGRDLLTLRIQKLESMGLYSEAIKLYSLNTGEPYHEKLARAGVLGMMEGGKGSLGCLETRTVMDRFGQLEFWQTLDAVCDISLAKMSRADGSSPDINDIDLGGSDSKILDRLAKTPNFTYRVSTPADIEVLTPLERAALQINNAFVFEHFHDVPGKPVSPAAFGIMLGNRNLSESIKFSILTESASYGLKPLSDIQIQYDLVKDDSRDKPVGWRMLPTLYARADDADPGAAQAATIAQAIDLSRSYGGAYALAPFADMLAAANPASFNDRQASDAVRAMIVSGKTVSAPWLARVAGLAHDRSSLLLVIAAELNTDLSTESKLNTPALNTLFGQLEPREKALIAALYEKLDKGNELHNYTVQDVYAKLNGLTASGDYVMPTSDLTESLAQAYKDKKLGESILLSAIALQGVQPGTVNPGLLQEVVDGMTTVGLTKEARILASEAILGLSN